MRVVRVPGRIPVAPYISLAVIARLSELGHRVFLFPFCCMHSTPSSEPLMTTHKTMASLGMALWSSLRRHCAHALRNPAQKGLHNAPRGTHTAGQSAGYRTIYPPRPVTWVHVLLGRTHAEQSSWACRTRVGSSADRGIDRTWTCCSRCSSEWPRWAKRPVGLNLAS